MIMFFISIFCVFVMEITGIKAGEAPQEDIKIVEIEKVSKGSISQTIRLIGTVKAKRSTILIAKTLGTLDHIALSGQKIAKGDLIAKLENEDLEKTYALSEHAEKITKTQYERLNTLSKTNTASKQSADERRNQWIEAQKSLAAAKIELDKTRFIAPFNGIVGTFKAREGAQVQAGDVIVTFYDPSELIVEFDIPSSVISFIRDGQSVQINKIALKLLNVQRMIDSDTHMSPAYVDYPCSDCVVGSTVDVDLSIADKKDILVVPFEAIFLRNGETFVYLVKDNKVDLQHVTTGIQEKDRIEIIDGLSEGDHLIIRGQARLYPGAAVKIHEPEEKSVEQQ